MKENSTEAFDSLFVKKYKGFKLFVVIFCLLLIAFTAVYAYLSIGAVRFNMEQAKQEVKEAEPLNPSLIDLMKDKAWIESRLKMASGDSIGLSIDLEQHLIQLELKGVVLMSTKIHDYSTSGFFKRMDGNVYFNMFGSPLAIKRYVSSIEKNPLKLIVAPTSADSITSTVTHKDSIPKQNVYWTVIFDRNFELNIQGIDSISESQSNYKLGQGFEFKRDLKNIFNSFKQVIRFKKPQYTPEILISIPENEAKAILRALPRNANVTIRI